MKKDYTLLANKLLVNIYELLSEWLPDGKKIGTEYKAVNPTRADSKIGSFSINLQSGKWADFATGDTGGNLITLYAYLFNLKNSAAYDELMGENGHYNYANYNPTLKPKKVETEEWELLPLPLEIPTGRHYQLGLPYKIYRYEDFYIFRYIKQDGTKDIRPLTYRKNINTGVKEWRWKGKPNDRAIYNIEKIDYKPILIVEGEKAGNVKVEGYTVISWAGGSNAISKTNWDIIKCRKDVFFWADRDKAGYKTVSKIKEILPLINIITVDFAVGDGQDIADLTEGEIKRRLEYFTKSDETDIPIVDEIVIDYKGKYPKFRSIDKGVVVARTGAGKTYQYENRANCLIIIPRVEQATVEAGENNEYLINKILTDGAMITYNKFYGHYLNSPEFKNLVDTNRINVIADEAHMLLSLPLKMHRVIYNLDAVFLSGTLDKFFRRDLQHYKYKPEFPEIIYYTEGLLPKIEGSLVLVDNARALMQNYPNNCIVSKAHDFESLDIHTTNKKLVLSTSCLREGISIKNKNFKANIVYAQSCQLWSTKDMIQGVHRVRNDDCIRLITKEPNPTYDKHIDFDWWENRVKGSSSKDRGLNAVLGEQFSNLIKITHKINDYEEFDDYGIACYLASLTRNNYDKDFYELVKCEVTDPLNIDLNTKTIEDEEVEIKIHTMKKDDTQWSYPANKAIRFFKWVTMYESGLLHR
nr:hypothetical protein [Sulfurovaceae bacterium]